MKNPKKILEVVNKLKNTTLRNDKISILKSVADDPEVATFFLYAVSPALVYGIKKLTPKTNTVLESTEELEFFTVLDQLNNRTVTGNNALSLVNSFLSGCTPEESDLFQRCINKDPDCGVSIATVNSVWNNLIPDDVKLCKAESYSLKNLEYIHYPAYSQTKMDGARCLAFVENNVATLKSSGQKVFHGLDTVEANAILVGNNVVLDGELLVYDDEDHVLPRKLGNGIISKSISNTISSDEAEHVHYVIWDIIPLEEYKKGKGSHPYSYTMTELRSIPILSNIHAIRYIMVHNYDEAFEHFQKMVAQGEEGTILKNLDFHWQGKRIHDLVKMKIEISNTLKVTKLFPGSVGTKYEKSLGSIECVSSDGKVTVNVGSGFSDEQRNSYTEKDLLDKYVEVCSNGLIKAEDGSYSLYLPRFTEIRFDKTEADSFNIIKSLSDGSQMLQK